VFSVADLTGNDRRVLLIFDGYRSHLSLSVLELFERNNIIVYALPAHTSGKSQPLDVVLFGSFKRALNNKMSDISSRDGMSNWDVFTLCSLMMSAYADAFTSKNVKAGFRRSGIWPLDSSRLLSTPRPAAPNNLETILGKEQRAALFEEKRTEMRSIILGTDAVLQSTGYIVTTCGEVMTSSNEMALMRASSNRARAVRDEAQKKSREREIIMARKRAREQKRRELIMEYTAVRRASLCGLSVAAYKERLRPMSVRRAAARLAAFRRRDAIEGN